MDESDASRMDFAETLYIAQPAPRAENASPAKPQKDAAAKSDGEFATKLEQVTAAPDAEPATNALLEAAPVAADPVATPQAPKPQSSALAFLAALQGVDNAPATDSDAAPAETAAEPSAAQPVQTNVAAPLSVTAPPAAAPAVAVAAAPLAAQADPAAAAAPAVTPAETPAPPVGEAPPSLDALEAALAAPRTAEPQAAAAPAAPTPVPAATAAAAPLIQAAAVAPVPAAPTKPAAPVAVAETAAPTAPAVQGDAPVEAAVTSNTQTASTTAKPATASPAGTQQAAAPAAQAASATPADIAMTAIDAKAAPAPQSGETVAPTLTTQTSHAASTSPALREAPAVAVQVFTRFVERFDGRAQRFEVSLDPAELGRVDVRIEIGADKKVHAVLAAHDSAALTDLMRGQRSLERALSDAGIDLADNGLSFELSTDGRSFADSHPRQGAASTPELAHVWRGFDAVTVPVEAETVTLAPSRPWRAQRLDLVA